jgi:hypothetical protein
MINSYTYTENIVDFENWRDRWWGQIMLWLVMINSVIILNS